MQRIETFILRHNYLLTKYTLHLKCSLEDKIAKQEFGSEEGWWHEYEVPVS